VRISLPFIAVLLAAPALAPAQQAMSLPENPFVIKVSEDVYAIIGFPNMGFVVGNRATLVIDTGMGARNGAIVLREAEKLAKAPNLYLTATHFHPEHAMGEQAFPPGTCSNRNWNSMATELMDLFRAFSPEAKELLKDVKMRAPDIVFDREIRSI
jgi:glyoxylase-like metal-dependent hydrolase (beta-lactamase superfamily II)